MAAQMNPKGQPVPSIKRAHRPQPADTITPIQADAYYPETEELPKEPTWLQKNLAVIGLGMVCMAALWYVGNFYVLPFVLDKVDTWNTGSARLSQYDLSVGHGGRSHFITQYWHNQVVVIEFPGGTVSNAHVYVAPVLVSGDPSVKRVVSLTTAHINPHGTKPDLVASISGLAAPVIFYNTGDGFRTEAP